MPYKSLKPCNYIGCPKLVKQGYCEEHQKKVRQGYEAERLTATERGYDNRWFKIRKIKLDKDTLCERHLKRGHDVPAALVHHKDRNPKNSREDNLESLCQSCHDKEHKGERWRRR